MQMQGVRQLAATAAQAWAALNDPEILKQCIPGCERFERANEDTYSLVVQIKIGPVSARFSGRVVLSEINPPISYTLSFDAQGGIAGFGKGASRVQLRENSKGVELQYTVSSQIGGKLAQLGQRLIDGAAKSLADDFFKRFEEALRSQTGQPSLASLDKSRASSSVFNKQWIRILLVLAVCGAAWFVSASNSSLPLN